MENGKKEIVPEYPETDVREIGYSAARAATGSIPLAGPALQEILSKAIASPLQKRRDEWFKSLGERLQELSAKIDELDFEKLAVKEEFISTVHHATEIAMRTHKEEKLKLLQNAIVNVALDLSINDILHGRFMSIVERYSVIHIQVLHILASPEMQIQYFDLFKEENLIRVQSYGCGLRDILFQGIKASKLQNDDVDIIANELSRDYLIETSVLDILHSEKKTNQPARSGYKDYTSEDGKLFLKFIHDPLNDLGE